MKITFLTLFPEYYESFKNHSIIKKAIDNKKIELDFVDIRHYALDDNVDDYIYGGGKGMLMMIEPIVKALRSIKTKNSYVILLGPRGKTFTQTKAKTLVKKKHIILICGHYEGVDSRILNYIDEEISIGKFILTGGEPASVIVADAITRLIPGVIKEESHKDESFENNDLLEYDQFTKPVDFEGHKVPDVLLQGNHKEIKKWRRQSSIDRTIELEIKVKKEEK